MSFFNILSTNPVTGEAGYTYNRVVFDGVSIYLLNACQPNVYQYDTELKFIHVYATSRVYISLCFDSRMKCFWAISAGQQSIFQLDMSFQEIGVLPLSGNFANIRSITYYYKHDTFYVLDRENIWEINKNGQIIKDVFCTSGGCVISIALFDKNLLTAGICNCKTILSVIACGKMQFQCDFDGNYELLDMAYIASADRSTYYFYILARMENEVYLIKTILNTSMSIQHQPAEYYLNNAPIRQLVSSNCNALADNRFVSFQNNAICPVNATNTAGQGLNPYVKKI